MSNIIFVKDTGKHLSLEAAAGETVMGVARRNNLSIEGACGGFLSCATCHVIVAPEDIGRLPPPEPDERDMLDLAFGVTATSRLGCQIILSDALNGLTVRLPPAYSA